MFLPYVIIGVNTSSLKMVSLLKYGRWEIGGQKLLEVGDWGSKTVGGGRLGGGPNLWEVGDWGLKYVGGGRLAPLCHPPPLAGCCLTLKMSSSSAQHLMVVVR